jgi:hypothetical protein
MSSGWRSEAGITIAVACIGLIGVVIGALLTHGQHAGTDIKMLELAVGLLKEQPNGPLQPARTWGGAKSPPAAPRIW